MIAAFASHKFHGYWVTNSWGWTERGSAKLRQRDGLWYDGDGDQVIFQENDDMPAESWLREPTSQFDPGQKANVLAVAVLFNNNGILVLDASEVHWLTQRDPQAIDWLRNHREPEFEMEQGHEY
jgi:hypothetical protein